MVTQTKASVPLLSVKVAGSNIASELAEALAEVVVESDRYLPSLAIVKFHLNSPQKGFRLDWPDSTMKDYLSTGKELEIVERKANGQEKSIFKGEVTALSLDYGGLVSESLHLTLQAQARSHRLHRGCKTRTFLNVKLSDIASRIASDNNLSADVQPTSGVFEYVAQVGQTDWDFLSQLAHRVGYEVLVVDKRLLFKKPQQSGQPVTLEWGVQLLQFQVRAATQFQASKVTVRGWDSLEQKPLVGTATSGTGAPQIGESRSGAEQAKQAFGDAEVVITDIPVDTQEDAQGIARSLADAIACDHIHAEGVCIGDSAIAPGVMVELKGIGSRFSGKYYVTAATHHYSGDRGYTTTFVVGGRRPDTLSEALGRGQRDARGTGRIAGVVPAIVTNMDDPKNLGRVKVKFPWMPTTPQGQEVESCWARVAVPDAGPQRGMEWLPEVNDEVLVAFEHGDIHRPYIIGGLWSNKNKPPENVISNGKNNKRVMKSRSGHQIILDDTDGAEQIVIRDKTGKNELIIDSKQNNLTISIEKDITIQAKGKVTVKATGDIALQCANFSLNASQKCEIKANAQMDITTNATLNMSGSQTSVEGKGRIEVKSNGQASVNSSGILQIRGSLVQIN